MVVKRDERQDETRAKGVFGLRFTVRGLLLLTLLVAMFLAGRVSMRPGYPQLNGSYVADLPAGFQQPMTIRPLEPGVFLLSGRASVFNGTYRWQDGRLVVIDPDDARMVGLQWTVDGDQLILTAEPPGHPTGASYLSTVLRPKKDEAKGLNGEGE